MSDDALLLVLAVIFGPGALILLYYMLVFLRALIAELWPYIVLLLVLAAVYWHVAH